MKTLKLAYLGWQLARLTGKAFFKATLAYAFEGDFGKKLERGALKDIAKTERYVAMLIEVTSTVLTDDERKKLEKIYEAVSEIE